MQLTNPTALLWALLAVPVVVFYILKIRLRRVPVSTSMFWDQVFEEKRPRSIWQRLRHLLSLLLQLAFLGLLVAAIADPFFASQRKQARRVVLVIDNSASMNAADITPSRLAAAKEAAYDLIRGLRWRDQMAIVTAGAVPRVACGLSSHQRTLSDAVEAIQPTDGPTTVAESVLLARRLIADRERAEIVLLSDGCFAEAVELNEADDIDLIPIGEDTANVGITLLQVRRSLIDVVGYQILLEVSNFSEEPAERRLELSLQGELIDVLPLKLEPGQVFRRVLDHTTVRGGTLRARLDGADALPTDDQAVALLPEQTSRRVVLVTAGNLFLQSVLESIPLVNLTVSERIPDTIPPGAVLVLHKPAAEELPAGRLLIIDPQSSTNLWALGEPLREPLVARQEDESPLLTHVQLENVVLPGARELTIDGPHESLADSLSDSPLYASFSRPEGKLLLLTVDLDKADLPLRTAFPILMTNALSWFDGQRSELREAVATGDLVSVELEPPKLLRPDDLSDGSSASEEKEDSAAQSQDRQLVLIDPGGSERALPNDATRLTIGPLDQCGVWQVVRRVGPPPPDGQDQAAQPDRDGEVLQRIACNLASPRESNVAADWEPQERGEIRSAGLGGRPLWFYLVCLGLALTTVEWYLYQRRWIS